MFWVVVKYLCCQWGTNGLKFWKQPNRVVGFCWRFFLSFPFLFFIPPSIPTYLPPAFLFLFWDGAGIHTVGLTYLTLSQKWINMSNSQISRTWYCNQHSLKIYAFHSSLEIRTSPSELTRRGCITEQWNLWDPEDSDHCDQNPKAWQWQVLKKQCWSEVPWLQTWIPLSDRASPVHHSLSSHFSTPILPDKLIYLRF